MKYECKITHKCNTGCYECTLIKGQGRDLRNLLNVSGADPKRASLNEMAWKKKGDY